MPIRLVYVTSNSHKQQEIAILQAKAVLATGEAVRDLFHIEIRPVAIPERLEIDLELMVRHEVVQAYDVLKVPCVVEHAGLVLDGFEAAKYPGGLTKPLWNALDRDFPVELRIDGRGATAIAAVGYCDGMSIHAFTGSTHGRLVGSPRGSREFYWDTVFVPDDASRVGAEQTYAEIVEESSLGLAYKVLTLSQSTKAMLKCLQFIKDTPANRLWA